MLFSFRAAMFKTWFKQKDMNMEMNLYLRKIEDLSKTNNGVVLYPYKNAQKLLYRFEQRLFWLGNKEVATHGWLGEMYKYSNGIDFCNFYIVPFNNYFNKKKEDFEHFCRSWIVNQNNPNEILADFYAFMTDGKLLIGYLDNLKDPEGNNFIGVAIGSPVSDVVIISSNIYNFLDRILPQLYNKKVVDIPIDKEFWIEYDQVLKSYYTNGKIDNYKKEFLYQADSKNYKSYK